MIYPYTVIRLRNKKDWCIDALNMDEFHDDHAEWKKPVPTHKTVYTLWSNLLKIQRLLGYMRVRRDREGQGGETIRGYKENVWVLDMFIFLTVITLTLPYYSDWEHLGNKSNAYFRPTIV